MFFVDSKNEGEEDEKEIKNSLDAGHLKRELCGFSVSSVLMRYTSRVQADHRKSDFPGISG
jgi:hypothetical protein